MRRRALADGGSSPGAGGRSRRRALGPLAAVTLASFPAVAVAQVSVRPLTEEEVKRAIPVLRVLAAGSEESRRERQEVEMAHQRAQRSHRATRGGHVDPVRAFREAGGDRLLPPGFRIDEACSRTLTGGGAATVVATAGFSDDYAAKWVGGCGPGGRLDPTLHQKGERAVQAARAHLRTQGFEEQGPRLAGKRFAAAVVPGNCFRSSPGRGCARLPSGPSVTFTDEGPSRAPGQVLEASQSAQQDREARVARAAAAVGLTPQDLDDLRAALFLARDDARDPGRLEALAAIPGELGAGAAVRRKNLAVYRRLEGEVGPLLEAIRGAR